MADWEVRCPPHAPPAVERDRKAVLTLLERLKQERAALETVRADVVKVEQADRERMAAALAAGREPKPDSTSVIAAQAAVNVAERRVQACELAIADSRRQLGATIRGQARKWSAAAADEIVRAQADAVAALDTLARALDRQLAARSTIQWLDHLARHGDAPKAFRLGGHARIASTRPATANGQGFGPLELVAWLGEAVTPPPPAQQQQHSRGQWPVAAGG